MKRITLIVFCLSLFLNENTSAQNKFYLSVGGGYISSPVENNDKLAYWENGYLINFSSDYKIANEVSLFLSASFQQHQFNSELVHIIVPAVLGYRYNISGENSTVIELSIGGKFYMSDTKIKPYIGIGTGALFINQGKIEITSWMEGYSERRTSIYYGSNKNYNIAQVNLGLGTEVELMKNFQLVLEGKFINSFEGASYLPLTASIKFSL